MLFGMGKIAGDQDYPLLTGPRGLIISPAHRELKADVMKVRSSLKSLKARHKDCRVVRRKGRVYVINKTQRRFKARQG